MNTEHTEQSNFVKWFRITYPDILIFAIPNGGARGDNPRSCAIRGRLLKDEGVLSGVPDLFIPKWKMFIEMKSERGCLSVNQKTIIKKLEECSYTTHVGTFEEIKKIFTN